MKFHRGFVRAKVCPGKQRETQVNGRGVEGIHGIRQVDAEFIVTIKFFCRGNQDLSKVCVDAPRARVVGVRESAARNLTAQSHVIQLGVLRAQARFDVSQTLSIC